MSRRPLLNPACVPAAALLLLVAGCNPTTIRPKGLEGEVDVACGGSAWRTRYGLAADLFIQRNDGAPDVRATFLYDTRNDRLVIQFPSIGGGVTRYGFDGQALWLDAPDGTAPEGWPNALQWAAWVSVPYRLTAPTLRVREVQPVSIAGVRYRIAELQRPADGPGTCALYVDPDTLRPRGCVPVRPAGAPDNAGPPPAYGFVYDEFSSLEDLMLPTRWSVWSWDPTTGIRPHGPIAWVTLDKPHFVQPDPSLFAPPLRDAEALYLRGERLTNRQRIAEVRCDAATNSCRGREVDPIGVQVSKRNNAKAPARIREFFTPEEQP